jgi:hypothetical protein
MGGRIRRHAPAAQTKYEHHLRAAGALGHEAALLEMAERFGDPAFFERPTDFSRASTRPMPRMSPNISVGARMPGVGERIAAQQGDTEAMRELIEGYDRLNLQQCWTWFYLAELLGTDLAKDEYRAINEDGSRLRR